MIEEDYNITPDQLDEMMKRELGVFDDNEPLPQEARVDVDKNDKKRHQRRGEGKNISFTIEKPEELLVFLREKMPDKSRTTIKSFLAHKQISVNGIPTTQFNHDLSVGDVVMVSFGVTHETFKNPFLRIVYEDDAILVVNKRNGLLTMATDSERQRTAYYILSEYLKQQDQNNRIFIVHRLDRETSGIVVFAKSQEVQHTFQYNWNEIVLERKYIAVVEGKVEQESGEVRSYLAENKAFHVYSTQNPEDGELAITRYKRLQVGRDNTMMELELETGKKNQIRVHMSDLGHPIVGDRKYGADVSPIGRLALHA
ncbi:MAG: pseudouridine synthase, partial [Rikenellaceae bacterium]